MYRTYLDNGTVCFYKKGVEINNILYPIYSDKSIYRIKKSIVETAFAEAEAERENIDENTDEDIEFDLEAEIAKIEHTEIVFDQPTTEQLEQIQSRKFSDTTDVNEFVQSVMTNDYVPSQEEINAMLMLEIAQLKAGVGNE